MLPSTEGMLQRVWCMYSAERCVLASTEGTLQCVQCSAERCVLARTEGINIHGAEREDLVASTEGTVNVHGVQRSAARGVAG